MQRPTTTEPTRDERWERVHFYWLDVYHFKGERSRSFVLEVEYDDLIFEEEGFVEFNPEYGKPRHVDLELLNEVIQKITNQVMDYESHKNLDYYISEIFPGAGYERG